jgi:hypothetical protein
MDLDRLLILGSRLAGRELVEESLDCAGARLVVSSDEFARLESRSSAVLVGELIRSLVSQSTWVEPDTKEVGSSDSRRPLIVAGPMRSGTTLIHWLICVAPGVSTTTHQQVEGSIESARRRQQILNGSIDGFSQLHPEEPDEPDELDALAATLVRGFRTALPFGLTSYLDWLVGGEADPGFNRALKEAFSLVDVDRIPCFKTPFLTQGIVRSILDAGFRVVTVARKPEDLITSWVQFASRAERGFGLLRDPHDVLATWSPVLRATLAGAASLLSAPDTIVVDYERLVLDPVRTATEVLAATNVSPLPSHESLEEKLMAITTMSAPQDHWYSSLPVIGKWPEVSDFMDAVATHH